MEKLEDNSFERSEENDESMQMKQKDTPWEKKVAFKIQDMQIDTEWNLID